MKSEDANIALGRTTFVIVEEIAGASILRLRIALGGEELPELEAMRLGLLLGLASSWKGWEGGDRTARVSSTDSTRGISTCLGMAWNSELKIAPRSVVFFSKFKELRNQDAIPKSRKDNVRHPRFKLGRPLAPSQNETHSDHNQTDD